MPDLPLIEGYYNKGTLGHEISHVIVRYVDGLGDKEYPLHTVLINEGLATYFDQSNKDFLRLSQSSLYKLGRNKISIKNMWEK